MKLQIANSQKNKIMGIYHIAVERDNLLRIGFGDTPAQNDVLVKEAAQIIGEMIEVGTIKGGELIKLKGPATLPIAFEVTFRDDIHFE